MIKKRKQYSQEFKEEAVKLLLSTDKTACQIAEELGCSVASLTAWKKKVAYGVAKSRAKGKVSEFEAATLKLRREVERLRQENAILKKAAAFFAKESL